jgi:dTDP-glucose pyrophosphorylase
MNVVIPLAGKDKRFDEKGVFKAFTNVQGKPLVKFCTDSIPYIFQEREIQIYFLVLKEHEEKYEVSKRLKELYSNCKIIIVSEMTEGAACTVLLAKEFIDNEDELVIYLADLHFSADLKKYLEGEEYKEIEGFLVTFKGDHQKYSYALCEGYCVKKVAEKQVISDNASAGFYYFRKGKYFVKAAEEMIKDDSKRAGLGEKKWFFICPVYNDLIEMDYNIGIIPSKFIEDLGCDEFVEKYLVN